MDIIIRHKAQELYGLILYDCAESLGQALDFINEKYEEAGVFVCDGRYTEEDCLVFEHDDKTGYVFPFLPHLPLDLDNLAIWRMRVRPFIQAVWVEDFIYNKLDDELEEYEAEYEDEYDEDDEYDDDYEDEEDEEYDEEESEGEDEN